VGYDSAGSDGLKTEGRVPDLMDEAVDVARLKLGTKLEIENMWVTFGCLTMHLVTPCCAIISWHICID
jgi:hypothetical protein